jgi:hypothetical protein
MVLETSVLSTFNHLTWLEARENFINLSRRESLKSYSSFYVFVTNLFIWMMLLYNLVIIFTQTTFLPVKFLVIRMN